MDFGIWSGVAVELVETEFGVGLGFADKKRGKPYFVDFATNFWRQRFQKGLAKNHIFARALGVRNRDQTRLLDATAGFGQDAALALCLGCEVVAIERSPLVAKVLRDGVKRALEDETLRSAFEHLLVVETDAREYLSKLSSAERPHVIYLDPMFDKPKKTAKSPKEMQLLQELLGEAPTLEEEEQLFDVARKTALERVIVKRPLKSRAVKTSPSHSYKGQSIRYDVYISEPFLRNGAP